MSDIIAVHQSEVDSRHQRYPMYQVDAFTDHVFGGNPAAVCPLDEWWPDEVMQKLAAENALAETAFIIPEGEQYAIRWFTPDIEMDLCGHATLAAAHVVFEHLQYAGDQVTFSSASGPLTVTRQPLGLQLDFPARRPVAVRVDEVPAAILHAFPQSPVAIFKSRDWILVYDEAVIVQQMRPDRACLDQINLDPGGVVITAPGTHYFGNNVRGNNVRGKNVRDESVDGNRRVDFVSRYFTPQSHIFEDPVTGSAHCSLVPYWAERLGRNQLHAVQCSDRIGHLDTEWVGDRVYLTGQAVTYLIGYYAIT
ncbi:PhzF family phenazine biosynthesis protein [Terasakiispira papahanaumokuakeensis]|nr:PhzF family phenazine biosynthesis protein [Terasakiispira papahanaumokuakeensis]